MEAQKFTNELTKAQTQKALRPDAIVLGDVEKDMRGYDNIVAQHGEDSIQAQIAKAILVKKGTFAPKGDTTDALDKAESTYQKMVELHGVDSDEAKRADINRQRAAIGDKAFNAKDTDNNAPTKATVTANQQAMTAIDNLLPQIKSLSEMNIPGQTTYGVPILGGLMNLGSGDEQANYHGKVSSIIDGYVTAMKFAKTDMSTKKAEDILLRKPMESESNYKNRLNEVQEDLIRRRANIEKAAAENKVGAGLPNADELRNALDKIQKKPGTQASKLSEKQEIALHNALKKDNPDFNSQELSEALDAVQVGEKTLSNGKKINNSYGAPAQQANSTPRLKYNYGTGELTR